MTNLLERALKNAELLERASEVIVARIVLAEACLRQPGIGSCRDHIDVLLAMPADSGAQWARERRSQLIKRYQAEFNV